MPHPRWSALLSIGLGALLASAPTTVSAAPQGPEALPPPEAERDGRLPELPAAFHGRFATSPVCAECHSNAPEASAMRDESGAPVAPFDLWRSTMMANASRDPLWRAVVSAEAAATPSRAGEIEAKCLRCHAPMAAHTEELAERPAAAAMLDGSGPLTHVAIDGVSCTLCHQVTPEGLGEPRSYSGRFAVGDESRIFGPHDSPFAMPMLNHTGYRPTEGDHVLGSALCGSCHTLFTDAVDAQGRPTGRRLPEQTPYLEWRNSAFNTEAERPGPAAADCQDCHAPKASAQGARLRTAIARNPHGFDFPPVGAREPFGRHLFVGGNTLVPAMLRDHADVLRPAAAAAELEATIAAARGQLETRTARVSVERLRREGSVLRVDVAVWNLSGHKFPTGHPSRRAWLRVRVTDADGKEIFASGGVDAAGRLVGPRGAPLTSERPGGKPQPHRRRIDRPDRVQVYEAVMADAKGRPTHLLMRGAQYVKDNRLLPRGWRSTHPGIAEIAPRGLGDDRDFVGGEDVTRYVVEVGDAPGPLRVEASLLYQSAGARYVAELLEFDTPQVRAFRRFYESADRTPALVASDARSEAP